MRGVSSVKTAIENRARKRPLSSICPLRSAMRGESFHIGTSATPWKASFSCKLNGGKLDKFNVKHEYWKYHQFWKREGFIRTLSSDTTKNITLLDHDADGDDNIGDDNEDEDQIFQHDQMSQNDETKEALIAKFLKLAQNEVVSEEEAQEIKSCIRYLESKIKKRKRTQDVDEVFQSATALEKLLYILLNEKSASQHMNADSNDSNEVYVTIDDFNRAMTAWRYAAYAIQYDFKGKHYNFSSVDRLDQMLGAQRRNACRSLYACEKASNLLKEMENSSHSHLRPNQYSYEAVLGSWSVTSGTLNFMLRSEGKAAAGLRKIPRRSTSLNRDDPWYDHKILENYDLMDPAARADEILERLFTMEELDSTEFKVSAWVMNQTMSSWIQVKAKPRRFAFQREDKLSPEIKNQLDEELRIPERAEELLWKIVDMVSNGDIEDSSFRLRSSLFRGVISSWSHSEYACSAILLFRVSLLKFIVLFH